MRPITIRRSILGLWAWCSVTALWAVTLQGQAVVRERIQLPQDARLKVELVELAAVGGAPRTVAHVEQPMQGASVMPFSLSVDDSLLVSPRRYVLRAQVIAGDKVWLKVARDRVYDLKMPAKTHELLLVSGDHGVPRADRGSNAAAVAYPDPLPASYQGELPGEYGPVHWHLNLLPNGHYQLRRTYTAKPQPNAFDDAGRWVWRADRNRLVLTSSRNVRSYFERGEDQHLLALDTRGRRIASDIPRTLQRQASLATWTQALRGPDWRLVAFGSPADSALPDTPAVQPHIVFDSKSQRVSGSAGCNRLSAQYTLDGEFLQLRDVALTRKACAQGMRTEQRFVQSLARVARYTIEGSELRLIDAGAQLIMRLEARAAY
ncbi:MAG: hypothetical protein Fur007_02080 [Rhodoferax sp.]